MFSVSAPPKAPLTLLETMTDTAINQHGHGTYTALALVTGIDFPFPANIRILTTEREEKNDGELSDLWLENTEA